jgi:hypothetical protein
MKNQKRKYLLFVLLSAGIFLTCAAGKASANTNDADCVAKNERDLCTNGICMTDNTNDKKMCVPVDSKGCDSGQAEGASCSLTQAYYGSRNGECWTSAASARKLCVPFHVVAAVASPSSNVAAPAPATNLSGSAVPGSVTDPGGIVQCGRTGQNMCTLCELIKGFHDIIIYIMKIAIGVALVAIAIGGVMYVVSAGDTGAIDTAKTTIKNALIGFVIIFAGYLIINTTILYLGSQTDANGNATFGFTITSWGNFECEAKTR